MNDKKILSPRTFSLRYYVNYMAIGLITAILAILSFAGALPQSTLFMLETISMNIVLAISLSLVVGFLGELSLGHAGFVCIGAYFGGFVAIILDRYTVFEGNGIVAFLIALAVGAVVAGFFGFLIGLPALRLKGDYLAIVTLAFVEIVKTIFENITVAIGEPSEENKPIIDGPVGIKTKDIRMDQDYLFIIGFIVVLITMAVIQNLIRSKHGRAITAIRDDEIAARATGINVTKYKLVAFIISAVFAGMAGVLFSYGNFSVSAANFDYNYSIEILIMVVLGGMASINGAIISATVITYLNIQLQNILVGDLAILKDIIYSLILILIIIYNNAPKLKNVREKYNLKRLVDYIRSKVFKNSYHYADDDDAWSKIPTKIEMNEIISTDIIVNESTKNPDKEGE